MISVDIKNDTNSSSPIKTSSSKEETTISFSDLLKGVKSAKSSENSVQNGTLILALDESKDNTTGLSNKTKTKSKTNSLVSLLKNEENTLSKKEEPLELHPKLSSELNTKEIKTLINDAKDYLKSKILQSDDYKKSQIKELPKTLKGLASLAKKFNIDISKITVEDVQIKDSKNIKTKIQEEPEIKAESKVIEVKTKTQEKHEIKAESKVIEVKTKIQENAKAQTELKPAEVKAQPQTELKSAEVKAQPQTELKHEAKPTEFRIKNDDANIKEEPKVEENIEIKPIKNIRDTKALNNTPLFKAQNVVEVTTEQIVQTKAHSQLKVDLKTPKAKADETLKLLLRGEKPNNTSFTADFSVATAKVIAPNATTESQRSLESLLRGGSNDDDNTTASKLDIQSTPDADGFEIKLKEAKQMIKYISQDVKTAIEDYKSPFTRVKVQLNPQKLGEVELTVVQRGKNLHVNLSSNNAAINTLSMNANELRAQLNNNGIKNASLNFNNNSQNSDSNASQQQNQHHNEQKAHDEYNYFDNEEANEEILNSLEIIVPQYG